MKIYYTTTSKTNDPQQKPSQSLGGFKSSSPVPNSAFGNLFSDISLYTLEKNLPEYIGLILMNERGNPISDVKIWLETGPSNLGHYKISVVELNTRNELEVLPTINAKPLYAEFYDAYSEETAIHIGEMLPNEMYGLWIERVVIEKEQNPNDKVEEINLKVFFNDGN